jgi:hypothetical protein
LAFVDMAQTLQHRIIARALVLIVDESRWTRAVLARTSDNVCCDWNDPSAVKFCALGALLRAASEMVGDVGSAKALAMRIGADLLRVNGRTGSSLPMINDVEGRATIVAMFERALR